MFQSGAPSPAFSMTPNSQSLPSGLWVSLISERPSRETTPGRKRSARAHRSPAATRSIADGRAAVAGATGGGGGAAGAEQAASPRTAAAAVRKRAVRVVDHGMVSRPFGPGLSPPAPRPA